MINCVQASSFAGSVFSDAHACEINSADVEPGQRADGGIVGTGVGITGFGVRVGVGVVVGATVGVHVRVGGAVDVGVRVSAGMGVLVGIDVGEGNTGVAVGLT